MLKKLKIKNFRKYDQLIIKFIWDENYISITGRNGVGKTTILEALNLLLSDNSSKFNSVKDTDFFNEESIELEVEFSDYYFLIYPDDSWKKAIPCKKYRKTIKRRDRKLSWSFFSPKFDIKVESLADCGFDIQSNKVSLFKSQYNIPASITPIKNIKYDEDTKSYSFSYISSENTFEIPEYIFSTLEKHNFPRVFYFDTNRDRELLYQYNTAIRDFIDELDWRWQKEINKDGNQDDSDSLLEMKEGITRIHRKHRDSYCSKILKAVQNISSELWVINSAELEFHYLDLLRPHSKWTYWIDVNNKCISVNDTGSGISMIMALSFLIAFANASKEKLIFLIDEPEIHLEPILQKKCYKYLIAMDTEVMTIVSTHSHLFLNKDIPSCNWKVEEEEERIPRLFKCNEIELADVQFRLLWNSLDDLYIPENIILVEWKHDKNLIIKLCEVFNSFPKIQILDCEWWPQIPNKADRYEKVIDHILSTGWSYSEYVRKNMKIMIDGDNASEDRIKNWKNHYSLEEDSVFVAGSENQCMEYLFDEKHIKDVVNWINLKSWDLLSDLNKDDIVKIILEDENKSIKDKVQWKLYISKSRFNNWLISTLSKNNISADLTDLYDFITI